MCQLNTNTRSNKVVTFSPACVKGHKSRHLSVKYQLQATKTCMLLKTIISRVPFVCRNRKVIRNAAHFASENQSRKQFKKMSEMKYILVTGGVISGVGKGVIASSFGTLLNCCGISVTSLKIDPYINIDAGTFSPYEHGKNR